MLSYIVYIEKHDHICLDGTPGTGAYWIYDAKMIPLCKVCDECKEFKLNGYRPEIIEGYDQDDVNEPIEADY